MKIRSAPAQASPDLVNGLVLLPMLYLASEECYQCAS
jgi:hypothetical protein